MTEEEGQVYAKVKRLIERHRGTPLSPWQRTMLWYLIRPIAPLEIGEE